MKDAVQEGIDLWKKQAECQNEIFSIKENMEKLDEKIFVLREYEVETIEKLEQRDNNNSRRRQHWPQLRQYFDIKFIIPNLAKRNG
ncbi:Hypothetical predicted protein [Cloeon dipterum]|uniref:Uncharacterized protein n=1 Tax=Cloeon dipterum TaxID=197152 RepID=A0A8S1DAH0_9INSE|nr:Hypothetical predicted protein [Cloeon dipterum]